MSSCFLNGSEARSSSESAWTAGRAIPLIYQCILDSRMGGPQRYVQSIRNGLGQEFETCCVTCGRGEMTELALVNWRQYSRCLYPLEVLFNGFRLARQLRSASGQGPLLLHVHSVANLAPLLAGRLARIPVIWHMHEEVTEGSPWWRAGRALAGRQLTQALSVTHRAASHLGDMAPETTVIPGAVDTGFWKRKKPIVSGTHPFRIVSVGHLNPLKVGDILMEALTEGLSAEWELTLVGERLTTRKAFARRLDRLSRKLVAKHGSARVSITGRKNADEIRAILEDSDLFVMPSLSEGCPIALLEAMAMELPCVASDVGDIAIMLGEHQRPWIVSPGSPEPLRNAIASIMRLPAEERAALGRANRERVLSHYHSDLLAERHRQIYRRAFSEMSSQVP